MVSVANSITMPEDSHSDNTLWGVWDTFVSITLIITFKSTAKLCYYVHSEVWYQLAAL